MTTENFGRRRCIRFRASLDARIESLSVQNKAPSFSEQVRRICESATNESALQVDREAVESASDCVRDLHREIKRIGVNVNQIAFRLNLGEQIGHADIAPVAESLAVQIGEAQKVVMGVLDAIDKH